jgi:endo-1,4-beta-xylanase
MKLQHSAIVWLCTLLTACGGGGASSPAAPSTPVVTTPTPHTPVSSLKKSAPVNLSIGVAASDDFVSNTKNHAIVEENFNQITAENTMKMKFLHPTENTYTFATGDAYVAYAKAHSMTVHAHTLIWHSDYQVPDFMKSYPGGKAEFLTMLGAHVTSLVAHFKGQVQSWDVVNEAIEDNGSYRNSIFYQKTGADYIDQAFINARAADPDVDLYYNDYSTDQAGVKFNFMKTMIDGLLLRKVPITGVGFQMHVLLDYPSTDSFRTAFKAMVDRGLKVKISELDVPVNNPYGSGFIYKSLTDTAANLQQKRYCEIVKVYLETVPANLRGGISVWGVRDSESWIPGTPDWKGNPDWPLLFDANGNKKPAYEGVKAALESKPCT